MSLISEEDLDIIKSWHKKPERKLYISTAGYGRGTPFEQFIKEKEKEMSNKINWKVNNITVDNRIGEYPTLHADIEATAYGFGIKDIMGISNEIRNRLNAPEKSAEEYIRYCAADVDIMEAFYSRFGPSTKLPEIKKVIFNNPATIVIWADDTKTVVKCQNDELYDPEKGLAMAITKKALGNEGNYFEVIKKWVGEYQEAQELEKPVINIFVKAGEAAAAGFEEAIKKLQSSATIKADTTIREAAVAYLTETLNNKKATKADLKIAMEKAIRTLGGVTPDA